MQVAEIFRSLQGEGRLTGTESVFIRASGCMLRCRFCDTRYASWTPEGVDLPLAAILESVERLAALESQSLVQHVVLTGGEPMMFPEIIPLCAELRQRRMHLTIETAGTIDQPVECDLMSISPKLSNSTPTRVEEPRWSARHERIRRADAVIRRLNADYDCQFKFVVDHLDDCAEVERYLQEFPEIDRRRVMLMPQGTDPQELTAKGEWLTAYCSAHGLTFCPRRHIEWFGTRRGT